MVCLLHPYITITHPILEIFHKDPLRQVQANTCLTKSVKIYSQKLPIQRLQKIELKSRKLEFQP